MKIILITILLLFCNIIYSQNDNVTKPSAIENGIYYDDGKPMNLETTLSYREKTNDNLFYKLENYYPLFFVYNEKIYSIAYEVLDNYSEYENIKRNIYLWERISTNNWIAISSPILTHYNKANTQHNYSSLSTTHSKIIKIDNENYNKFNRDIFMAFITINEVDKNQKLSLYTKLIFIVPSTKGFVISIIDLGKENEWCLNNYNGNNEISIKINSNNEFILNFSLQKNSNNDLRKKEESIIFNITDSSKIVKLND